MKRSHLAATSTLIATVLFTSCAKKEAPATDTTVAVTSTAVTATPMTRSYGPAQPFQLLAEDDSSITVDTEVLTSAIIVNRTTPPATDTLIGRILNTSSKKEKRYKFKPQDQAEYYLYASHNTVSGSTGWYINERKKNDKEKLFLSGSFGPCESSHPSSAANLGFKWCGSFGPRPGAKAMKKSSMLGGGWLGSLYAHALSIIPGYNALAPRDGTDDPAWVACTDGCCTLGNNSVNPKQQ
jgi:hypothetical protein